MKTADTTITFMLCAFLWIFSVYNKNNASFCTSPESQMSSQSFVERMYTSLFHILLLLVHIRPFILISRIFFFYSHLNLRNLTFTLNSIRLPLAIIKNDDLGRVQCPLLSRTRTCVSSSSLCVYVCEKVDIPIKLRL